MHPLGAVPKKNGGVRIIHDCSAPKGASLNDMQTCAYTPWASIDDILRHVTPGCFLAGVDISEYYRNFPVNPLCWPLQRYADAQGRVIIDSRLQAEFQPLCAGCCLVAMLFQLSLSWMISRL